MILHSATVGGPRGEIPPPPMITMEPPQNAEKRFYGEAETNPAITARWHTVAMVHKDMPALRQRAAALAGDRPVEFQEIIRENTADLLKQLRKFPAVQLVLGIPARKIDSETITLLRSRSNCPVILVK